ncbi:hypothetical protein I3760_11G065000 [Carya illinoinensis]|nr:hypothetical protein I3760_11G065000 [Carya illinoinensis]
MGRLKDGKIAAIKVLSAESKQGVKEFLTEINVISEIEHENLVKLYGCCVEENHRILVYNYLENNSLAQTLIVSGGSQSNMYFKWRTRTKICIGIARGLAFLHEEVRPHIIHRDIKASNILLDKDLTPKISDFGLAKLIPPNMTHVSTRVAGTIGYLAPEYAIKGQLTRKADIYSFGVLLLEIVSGRCNTNTRLPFEEQYLLERICFSSAFFSLHAPYHRFLQLPIYWEDAELRQKFRRVVLRCSLFPSLVFTHCRPTMATLAVPATSSLRDPSDMAHPIPFPPARGCLTPSQVCGFADVHWP